MGYFKRLLLWDSLSLIFIVIILSFVIYPRYVENNIKIRRYKAVNAILDLANVFDVYYRENNSYLGIFTQIENYYDKLIYHYTPDGMYLINFEYTNNSYKIIATPQYEQKKDKLCGTLTISNTNIKTVSGNGSIYACWHQIY